MSDSLLSWGTTHIFIRESDRRARGLTVHLTPEMCAGRSPEQWELEKADALLSLTAMQGHDSEAIRDLREARSRWPDPV
jgi:hypothetical protein